MGLPINSGCLREHICVAFLTNCSKFIENFVVHIASRLLSCALFSLECSSIRTCTFLYCFSSEMFVQLTSL